MTLFDPSYRCVRPSVEQDGAGEKGLRVAVVTKPRESSTYWRRGRRRSENWLLASPRTQSANDVKRKARQTRSMRTPLNKFDCLVSPVDYLGKFSAIFGFMQVWILLIIEAAALNKDLGRARSLKSPGCSRVRSALDWQGPSGRVSESFDQLGRGYPISHVQPHPESAT